MRISQHSGLEKERLSAIKKIHGENQRLSKLLQEALRTEASTRQTRFSAVDNKISSLQDQVRRYSIFLPSEFIDKEKQLLEDVYASLLNLNSVRIDSRSTPTELEKAAQDICSVIRRIDSMTQLAKKIIEQENIPSVHPVHTTRDSESDSEYDAFISHASEDKEDFVRPLACQLIKVGCKIWYDEMTLKVGDSLRRSIDEGLARSRFGIVVLSHHFFKKNWTKYELDGLVDRHVSEGKVILPLWHNITKEEIMKNSLSLADIVAINTSTTPSINEVASTILSRIKHCND